MENDVNWWWIVMKKFFCNEWYQFPTGLWYQIWCRYDSNAMIMINYDEFWEALMMCKDRIDNFKKKILRIKPTNWWDLGKISLYISMGKFSRSYLWFAYILGQNKPKIRIDLELDLDIDVRILHTWWDRDDYLNWPWRWCTWTSRMIWISSVCSSLHLMKGKENEGEKRGR